MVAKTTLQRYIKRLDDVILSGDSSTAEEIQEEILAALGSDIDGLKRGLECYAANSSRQKNQILFETVPPPITHAVGRRRIVSIINVTF